MTAPYYSDESVTLYHGDFREVLPTLDVAADLIVTDPPYGETSLDWDVWPGGWPSMLAAYAPAMWCFGSMRMFLEQRHEFARWKFSQDIVWEKHNGSSFASDRFRRVHEHVTHWYLGDWAGVHHEVPRVPRSRGSKSDRRSARGPAHTGAVDSYTYVDDGLRLTRSVLKAQSMQGKAINETEKPTSILEPLIAYGCSPGGLVLDVFAGSSSTLAAARATGRRAIGVEKRESQCEKAALRLSQGVLDFGGVA